jgi:hypothetical protein
MGLEVFAEKLFATTAVEAFTAELRVVGNHSVTDTEPLDFGS